MTPEELSKNCVDRVNEASHCRASGDTERAITICNELIGMFPDYWAAWHTAGLAYSDKHDYQRALDCLVRASIIAPDNWKTLSALSEVYLNLGAPKLGARTIEAAISGAGANADLCYMQGDIYRRDTRFALAETAYGRALDLDPGFYSAIMGRALCLAELGQLEAAARLYEELIAADPTFFEALFELASLPSRLWKTDVVARIAFYEDALTQRSRDFQVSFYFAKANALNAVRRYEEAWASLLLANGMERERMQEELKKTLEFQRTCRERLPSFIKSRGVAEVDQNTIQDAPFSLFILGPSRCGKSTAEYLLSRVDGICPGYENPLVEESVNAACATAGLPVISSDFLPDRLYTNFRDIYQRELPLRAGAARVFINTNPAVIKDIVLMLKAVPNTRVIFIKRNLQDNIFKIFSKLYGVGNAFAYDLRAIRDYILWYNSCIDIIADAYAGAIKVVAYDEMASDGHVLYRAAAELLGMRFGDVQAPAVANDRGCSQPYAKKIQSLLAA